MSETNNNFNKKPSQLYPDEAYNSQQSKPDDSQQGNPLFPLLLSALQNNGDKDNNALLSSLLSGMSGSNQGQLIQTLASSLNKKKKEPSKPLSSEEKPFPKNDLLF